jgi:methylated-DNA-[protein]-cysteine S-methyltransferase
MVSLYTKNVDDVWFGVACDGMKILATTFTFSQHQTTRLLLRSIPFNVSFQHVKKPSDFATRTLELLKDIYDGKDVSHTTSLDKSYLSSYAAKVLDAVSMIPVGYVASYGSVAKAVGGSPRAVGRVMSLNPFPLIVPCHRVVRSDFRPGGYGGGVNVKVGLLKRESRGYNSKKEISIDDRKLVVYPAQHVLEGAGKK